MAAPSESFDAPTAAEIAVDKPNKSSIQVKIRESLIHLEEWLGNSFVAAKDHNHDGINSAVVGIGTAQVCFAQSEEDIESVGSGGSSYQTQLNYRFYVAVTGTYQFNFGARIKTSSGLHTAFAAINIDTVGEISEVSNASTSYAWDEASADAASLAAGWHDMAIRVKSTGSGGGETSLQGFFVSMGA